MQAFFRKWGVCLLLFLATTLNYLDRQTLGILAPSIQKEMGLGNEALGWLFAVFYYSYTFAQFGIGLLLDRYNLRWTYGLAVLAWSAACASTGLARGFFGLIGFRLLLGITESANWPAAMRVVSRVLPPADRPLGNGIFTSGTSVGALIAPTSILAISAWFGWRWAFVAVGSLGLIWFLAWLWFTREQQWSAGSRTWPAPRIYSAILRDPQFWRVFAVTILVNPCLYFNLNWLPTYFVQQRGVAAGRELGGILALIYLGLDLGYLACGASAMMLARRGWPAPKSRRAVFLAATGLLLLSSIVPLLADRDHTVAALVVVNFALGVWISMYLTMAQEVSTTQPSGLAASRVRWLR
ncbi:MAG: MFS transporter [Acidobacteria bacterium]|nr:MFS transporter [Acidobacteriota bacterium]